MKHICHILTTFQQRASITRRTTAILKECVAQGFQTSLIIGADNDAPPIEGVETIIIPGLHKHVSPANDLKAYQACKKVLQQLKPDIVHTHQAKAGVLGRLAASKINKTPHILHTIHGPTFPQHLPATPRLVYRNLERLTGRVTDKFVFIGEELKQEYIQAGVCHEDNSVIIRTGKPDNLLNRKPISDSEREKLRQELCSGQSPHYLMTYIARIVPGKQHEHAIEILHQLRTQGLDVHLSFVGKALIEKELDYEQRLKTMVRQLGLEAYVHFSGFYNNVYDVMEASDLVIMTSSYEGLSNIVIESMLLKIPVMAYEVAGLKELFGSQFEQFTVKQGDIQGFVNKAAGILRMGYTRDIYLPEIVERLRAEHQLKTMLERKMNLYRTLN